MTDATTERNGTTMSDAPRCGSMKAPFPYFGGKRKIAAEAWARFGAVRNYVEPFCGSCAVLLSNPNPVPIETINDACGYIANFWRAVKAAPDAVAEHADYPVSELDLHARGDRLFYGDGAVEFRERMRADPDFYDARVAGWWVWGQCAWIGSGWGARNAGRGVNRQRPHLGDAGRGVYIRETMQALAARLRDVRITCGDWRRVLGPSVTTGHGMTAVFLDPPYDMDERYGSLYSRDDDATLWPTVCAWCEERGQDPLLRIALCGYSETWTPPVGWTEFAWTASGGYGAQGQKRGRANAYRERVWFSPACETPQPEFPCHAGQLDLFTRSRTNDSVENALQQLA